MRAAPASAAQPTEARAVVEGVCRPGEVASRQDGAVVLHRAGLSGADTVAGDADVLENMRGRRILRAVLLGLSDPVAVVGQSVVVDLDIEAAGDADPSSPEPRAGAGSIAADVVVMDCGVMADLVEDAAPSIVVHPIVIDLVVGRVDVVPDAEAVVVMDIVVGEARA